MTKFETLQEFENFYDAMLPAEEKSEEAFVWLSGIPHPFFNAVMHVAASTDVTSKVDLLLSHNRPLSFWIHSENKATGLVDILTKRGFAPVLTYPLMTWQVQQTEQQTELPQAQIAVADWEIFHDILAVSFQLDTEVKKQYAQMLEHVEAEHYLLYLDGRAVCTGTLIVRGKMGGIFNIATLPEYQQRGCGRSMMQFLMHRAAQLELDQLILLSSPVGKRLYSSLGFTTCLDIELYLLAAG